jgi:hypothetical protein
MPHHDFTELETKAIDDVIRAWRTWARARGLDPDQPSRIDLYAFAHFLAQQAEKDGPLPLPGRDDEYYSALVQRAMALRGFTSC